MKLYYKNGLSQQQEQEQNFKNLVIQNKKRKEILQTNMVKQVSQFEKQSKKEIQKGVNIKYEVTRLNRESMFLDQQQLMLIDKQ